MTGCPAFEPLLLDRSSGTIEAADAARLDAHLRTCSACRAEAAALDEVRTLVTLPPRGRPSSSTWPLIGRS